MKRIVLFMALLFFLAAFSPFPASSQVGENTEIPAPMDAYTVIQTINEARTSNGLPTLTVDNTLMNSAQATADTMASQQLHTHIGNVVGRITSAGYGGGVKVYATENFAMVKPGEQNQLMSLWADDAHQVPMVNPNFKQIGAGVAYSSNGFYYYVVHAAYSSGSVIEATSSSGSDPAAPTKTPVPPSNYIVGVVTVTPQIDGKLVHTVRQGQTLWSIAMAYHTHILDIQRINNLPTDYTTTYQGQKLIIPTSSEIPPTATASLTPSQLKATITQGVPKTTSTTSPTPTPVPTPGILIPTSILPNIMIGLIFSVFGILAMYGAFSSKRR